MSQEEKRAPHSPSRRRKMPLTGYMVILFAVAFLLLFMAYCQQQRQNTEATNDALKQSVSAVDTIQTMMQDNQALRSQVEELESQVEALEQRLSEAETFGAEAQSEREGARQAVKAMGYFWQIDEAYVRQRYTLCRELIGQFEAEQHCGPAALPEEEFPADNGRFSPRARYQEIYDALY